MVLKGNEPTPIGEPSESHDDGATPVRHTKIINLFKQDDPAAESEFANAQHTFSTTLHEDDSKLIAVATASGRRLVESGQLERAESLQNLILAVYRDSLGTGNKETLWAMHDVARTMRLRGKHDDALALMEEAIEQGHNVWTKDDLDARRFMHEVAQMHRELGHFQVALEMFRSIAQDFERILGLDNAETLTAIHNLAAVRMDLGDRKTAAALFEKVWETRCRVFGDEAPQTTHSLASLASLRLQEGMHQDAISLQRVVLDSARKRFGEAHPDTLRAKAQLANTLRYTGINDEAGTLFAQVLESRGQDFDEEAPEVLSAINDYANWLLDSGQATRAQPMFEKVLEYKKKTFGERHLQTAMPRHNLAAVLRTQGKLEDAKELLVTAYEILGRSEGRNDVYKIAVANHLTTVMFHLGWEDSDAQKQREAVALQETLVRDARSTLGKEHALTAQVTENCIFMMREIGMATETTEMEARDH